MICKDALVVRMILRTDVLFFFSSRNASVHVVDTHTKTIRFISLFFSFFFLFAV